MKRKAQGQDQPSSLLKKRRNTDPDDFFDLFEDPTGRRHAQDVLNSCDLTSGYIAGEIYMLWEPDSKRSRKILFETTWNDEDEHVKLYVVFCRPSTGDKRTWTLPLEPKDKLLIALQGARLVPKIESRCNEEMLEFPDGFALKFIQRSRHSHDNGQIINTWTGEPGLF